MRSDPKSEPCGCPWGNADTPFQVDSRNPRRLHPEYLPDDRLKHLTTCLECGAVWSSKDDDEWVVTAERMALGKRSKRR